MGTVPQKIVERVMFYQNHLTPWTDNAAAIGLTTQQVGDFALLVIAANNAMNAAEAARDASKAATLTFHESVRTLHGDPGAGADLIRTIQNFAMTTDDPNVYALAQIPAPQPSSAAPPPGTPFEFTVGLLALGELTLGWKSNNPSGTSGTVYEVRRSLDNAASFETIGITGERSFTDDTLASGCAHAVYAITGIRSTKRGATSTLTVRFGVGGASIVSSATLQGGGDEGIKLAA